MFSFLRRVRSNEPQKGVTPRGRRPGPVSIESIEDPENPDSGSIKKTGDPEHPVELAISGSHAPGRRIHRDTGEILNEETHEPIPIDEDTNNNGAADRSRSPNNLIKILSFSHDQNVSGIQISVPDNTHDFTPEGVTVQEKTNPLASIITQDDHTVQRDLSLEEAQLRKIEHLPDSLAELMRSAQIFALRTEAGFNDPQISARYLTIGIGIYQKLQNAFDVFHADHPDLESTGVNDVNRETQQRLDILRSNIKNLRDTLCAQLRIFYPKETIIIKTVAGGQTSEVEEDFGVQQTSTWKERYKNRYPSQQELTDLNNLLGRLDTLNTVLDSFAELTDQEKQEIQSFHSYFSELQNTFIDTKNQTDKEENRLKEQKIVKTHLEYIQSILELAGFVDQKQSDQQLDLFQCDQIHPGILDKVRQLSPESTLHRKYPTLSFEAPLIHSIQKSFEKLVGEIIDTNPESDFALTANNLRTLAQELNIHGPEKKISEKDYAALSNLSRAYRQAIKLLQGSIYKPDTDTAIQTLRTALEKVTKKKSPEPLITETDKQSIQNLIADIETITAIFPVLRLSSRDSIQISTNNNGDDDELHWPNEENSDTLPFWPRMIEEPNIDLDAPTAERSISADRLARENIARYIDKYESMAKTCIKVGHEMHEYKDTLRALTRGLKLAENYRQKIDSTQTTLHLDDMQSAVDHVYTLLRIAKNLTVARQRYYTCDVILSAYEDGLMTDFNWYSQEFNKIKSAIKPKRATKLEENQPIHDLINLKQKIQSTLTKANGSISNANILQDYRALLEQINTILNIEENIDIHVAQAKTPAESLHSLLDAANRLTQDLDHYLTIVIDQSSEQELEAIETTRNHEIHQALFNIETQYRLEQEAIDKTSNKILFEAEKRFDESNRDQENLETDKALLEGLTMILQCYEKGHVSFEDLKVGEPPTEITQNALDFIHTTIRKLLESIDELSIPELEEKEIVPIFDRPENIPITPERWEELKPETQKILIAISEKLARGETKGWGKVLQNLLDTSSDQIVILRELLSKLKEKKDTPTPLKSAITKLPKTTKPT